MGFLLGSKNVTENSKRKFLENYFDYKQLFFDCTFSVNFFDFPKKVLNEVLKTRRDSYDKNSQTKLDQKLFNK